MSTTSISRRSKLQRNKTITSFGDTISHGDQSEPVLSAGSTIPQSIISFRHSYGYNCKKPYNLYLLGSETLVFLSGNLIHFLDTKTLEITVRRSVLGTGIGCITKNSHPNYRDFLTIGENGVRDPPILIYNYPDMELQRKLVGGARRNHTRVTYSADGELLASQSGEPDFVLTIWKWREAEILLRLQSFAKDVYNLKFSSFTPELLTSSGAGHIKFWKIVETFTGMKLQGDVGRFGKTEISDIYGLYQLEDGKVLSGSDWGNILVWENNSIKYEVFRKNHKTCHNGPITQIICHDQEVLTVSLDGYVRSWFWETVESSCPAEEENFVEVEPIFEVKIGTRNEECHLMSMVKDPDPASSTWYIQDGNGGIWSCGISSNGSAAASRQLYKCHAGAIIAAGTSPCRSYIATLGADGRLHIYDYVLMEMIYQRKFPAKGAAIVWPALSVASAGNNLIVAFESGVIRILAIEFNQSGAISGTRLIQVLKSHTRAITQMSINSTEEILVTGGEDHTIFVHGIVKGNSLKLIPIGMVILTSLISFLNWNNFKSPTTVLVGCRFGEIFEIELPDKVQDYTALSYELKDLPTRTLRFKSKKSEIKRLIKVKDFWYRKTFRIDEESQDQSVDFQDDEPDSHFVPPIPNKVLWLETISKDRLWISMAQFDAGFIYEYEFDTEEGLQRVIPIPGCPDLEINCFVKVNDIFIFGLSNGVVRVTRAKEDPTDLSDYWQLGMHDNENGTISSIVFSGDPSQEYLFTSGFDGNLFQYKWTNDKGQWEKRDDRLSAAEPWSPVPEVDDVNDQDMLAFEQEKRKVNDDQRHTICEANKTKVVNVLNELKDRFNRIWCQNQSLPESQRVEDGTTFELDSRITEDLNETLERKMKMAQREMQYDVEKARIGVRKLMTYFIDPLESFPIELLGIRAPVRVQSFRVRKLDEEFYRTREDLDKRMNQFKEESKERRQSMSVEFSKPLEKIPALSSNEEEFRVHRIESILREMGDGRKFSNLHTKIRRLLKKYKERKAYEQERRQEWEAINQQKPNPDIDHPDDVQAMTEGQSTIGDFKLKLDEDYIPPENGSDSLLAKLQEILNVQERIFTAKKEYNDQIRIMRVKKEQLLGKIKQDAVVLQKIHAELPQNMRIAMVDFSDFQEDVEFPEKFIGIKRTVVVEIKKKIEEHEGAGVVDHLTLSLNNSEELTRVESELKAQRIQEKAFEQDLLLDNAANEINKFDEDLKKLSQHRLTVEMDTLFLDSYLLSLQKEYNIIHGYYEDETKLSALVDEKRIENGQFLSKILTQETALEMAKKNIEMYNNEKKILQQTFDSNCLDIKFTDFLKWIFEKSEEEAVEFSDSSMNGKSSLNSSTMSSGSQEGSSVSITSSNYDETFCPRGCDPDLYKLAFELRTSRFEMNRKISEENQVYDRVRGDLDFLTKEIMEIQQEQAKREKNFVALRREKQRKLNEIETFLVLRLDQLQYFKDESEFGDISRTLLFKRPNLMRLYARVGELSAETAEIKRKHRVNIVLLSRLKTDCHYLEQLEAELKDNIKDTMVKKFGMPINLDELQEALLKRLLFEIRLNVDDVELEFRQKISEHKMIIQERQIELTKTIQEGTEKLNILTVLHEEKNNLDEILANQIKLRRKQEEKRIDFSKDIDRLRQISREQVKQIECLQRDIRTLSLKCKPFSSVPSLPSIALPSHEWHKKNSGDILEFEGSAYASILTSEGSTDGLDAQFSDRLRGEIERVVVKYLRKQLQHRLMEKQLLKIACQIVGYFLRVLATFDYSRRDELIPCVVEDFLKFFPRESSLVLSPNSVANLFERVLRIFKSRDEVDAKEIIWGIIENASEVVGSATDGKEKINSLLIEMWRQLLIALPLREVQGESFAQEVHSCLSRLNDFSWGSQNPEIIIREVTSFVLDNSTEDISLSDIEKILNMFFSLLS